MMQLLGNKTVSILAMYKTYQKDFKSASISRDLLALAVNF